MKKFYLTIISLICCAQNIQTMGSQQIVPVQFARKTIASSEINNQNHTLIKSIEVTNNQPRFIPVQVDRWDLKTGEQYFETQIIDNLSEKLYKPHITETEIEELVQQGANVNYQRPRYNRFEPETVALPIHFAKNNSEQGIANMKTIINLGAKLHNIPNTIETPLEIALRSNYYPMIHLLLPYERPIVRVSQLQERRIRELAIYTFIINDDLESISILLSLNLTTANQVVDTCIEYKKFSPKVINYLLKINSINNYNHHSLGNITKQAFSNSSTHALILYHLTNNGAFNKEAFQEISELKDFITAIYENLEKNKPK